MNPGDRDPTAPTFLVWVDQQAMAGTQDRARAEELAHRWYDHLRREGLSPVVARGLVRLERVPPDQAVPA